MQFKTKSNPEFFFENVFLIFKDMITLWQLRKCNKLLGSKTLTAFFLVFCGGATSEKQIKKKENFFILKRLIHYGID